MKNVPETLSRIYGEARICTSHQCYTAAVMLSRKLLMHIAVEAGAKANLKFIEYVEYLSANNYVPPKGKHWVDHIREKGNEANHEVKLMSEKDAKDLLTFIEMLLRFNYEFPQMISPPAASTP